MTHLAAKTEIHKRAVCGLYRHSLKNILNWCVNREVFLKEIGMTRQLFEVNRNAEPALAGLLLKQGQEKLAGLVHPDPYIVPTDIGGTKYQRSVDFPHDKVSLVYNYGMEPHIIVPPNDDPSLPHNQDHHHH